MISARAVFFGQEDTSVKRPNAEYGKKVGTYLPPATDSGFPAPVMS